MISRKIINYNVFANTVFHYSNSVTRKRMQHTFHQTRNVLNVSRNRATIHPLPPINHLLRIMADCSCWFTKMLTGALTTRQSSVYVCRLVVECYVSNTDLLRHETHSIYIIGYRFHVSTIYKCEPLTRKQILICRFVTSIV